MPQSKCFGRDKWTQSMRRRRIHEPSGEVTHRPTPAFLISGSVEKTLADKQVFWLGRDKRTQSMRRRRIHEPSGEVTHRPPPYIACRRWRSRLRRSAEQGGALTN